MLRALLPALALLAAALPLAPVASAGYHYCPIVEGTVEDNTPLEIQYNGDVFCVEQSPYCGGRTMVTLLWTGFCVALP